MENPQILKRSHATSLFKVLRLHKPEDQKWLEATEKDYKIHQLMQMDSNVLIVEYTMIVKPIFEQEQ
jgi:hypothetical protein